MRAMMDEKGSALIIVVVMTLIITGMAGAYLWTSAKDSDSVSASEGHIKRLYIAESGIAAGLSELRATQDYAGDGRGNVTEAFSDGTSYAVTAVQNQLADDSIRQYTLTSVGEDNTGHDRAIEVIVQTATAPLDGQVRAAVTSLAPVETTGTITIDGRDHDPDGNLVDTGVDGILCGQGISAEGASGVGGNGIAPVNGAVEADGVFDENFDFSTIYPDGYPDNPDKVFEVTDGTLKAAAQGAGTYFDNQADYDAFLVANGGSLPGGEIIYLDFDECISTEIGDSLNDPPSILVMHNSSGDSNMKNVHGQFRGMIIADSITHVNAGTQIIGAVQTLWKLAVGNVFGNGNSDILFSSEVLANLPRVVQIGGGWNVTSWREVPVPTP